jgi:hypothetical protein
MTCLIASWCSGGLRVSVGQNADIEAPDEVLNVARYMVLRLLALRRDAKSKAVYRA